MKNLKINTNTIFFSFSFKLQYYIQNKISRKGLHTFPFEPVRIYANADVQKLEILKENEGKSGIYMWKNLLNGKIYVGSAKDLKRRLTLYYSINHLIRESSMYINRALLKEGYFSFSLSILEYCDQETLIQREQYYIDNLKPDYNLCLTAGSTLGKLHSDNAKNKISVTKKGTYSSEANHFYGKTHTDEAIQKMKEAKLGKKLSEGLKKKISNAMAGRKLSEEHKINLCAAQPNSKKLSVLDTQTGIETTFNSMAEAERTMGFPKDSIRANLRSKNKAPYKGRYYIKVID